MISLLKKLSAVAVFTTAISLVGMKANLAQASTYKLDIEVGNKSFSGFLDVVDDAFEDNWFEAAELEQLVINNFALGGPSVSPPITLIFNNFDAEFKISVADLLNDTLNDIEGKLVGKTDDGSSSFSLLVGNRFTASDNELEFYFESPILEQFSSDETFSVILPQEQVEQTDVLSITLTSVPEPASILGLFVVGAAGAVSTLKRKQK